MPANYSKPPVALALVGFYSWASRTVSGGMIVLTFRRFNILTFGKPSSHHYRARVYVWYSMYKKIGTV